MPYTFDEETKKVLDNEGNPLSRDDLLAHLNQMFYSLDAVALGWRRLHDIFALFEDDMDFLDSIFLGAGAGMVEGEADDTSNQEVEDEGRTEQAVEE